MAAEKKKPIDALESAIMHLMLTKFFRPGKPGQVIESLNKEHRETLSKLTSDDCLKHRPDKLLFDCFVAARKEEGR